MTGKDIPAWIADGGNNAGTIAKSQIKIGDGNTNPDAGLQSSIATPPEAISVAPQKPGVPADSEPKSKSKPKKQKALPVRRGSGRTTPKTPKVAPAGIAQASVADPALAIAPIPDPMPAQVPDSPKPSDVPSVVNATELQKGKAQPTQEELAEAQDKERKIEERTRLVQDAQTPEELCDIVASFDSVSSNDLEDVSGDELAHYMRGLLDDARKRFFDTYEEFEKAWKMEYPNVPKAYGIQEKFDAFLREKMRREFSQSLPLVMTPEEEKESASKQQWDTFKESVKGKESVVLVSPDEKEELILTMIADKWFDSKGKGVSDDAIKEKLRNNWRPFGSEDAYYGSSVFADQVLDGLDVKKVTYNERGERILVSDSPEAKATILAHGVDESTMREAANRQASVEAVRKIDSEIKSLEEKLDKARKVATHAEYQNASVWKRLKQTLGITPRETDKAPETIAYKGVLNDLLKLKLDRVEAMKDNFTPSEYKRAIAEALQVFKTESEFKYDDAYIETARENKGFLEKLEDIGRWYNKQSKWKKIGVGAVLATGAFFTGGSLGSLMIPILVKKAVGTAGLFATFDPMFEKALRDRLEKKIAKESENEVKESEETVISIDVLKLKLQKEIDELDQNFLRRKRERLARKASIALFAGAIGFGSTFFSHASEAAEAKDVAKGAGSAVTAAVESENTAPAMGAGTAAREQLDRALRGGVDGKVDVPPVSPGVAEAAKNAAGVPAGVGDNIYEVSKGDTVDGLIGSYLSEHYQNFDGMTDGQKTHAINALERQLKHLSPEQLKLAGIGSGNIHSIQVEELVDLDKLFSAGDADKVMGKAAKISAEAVKNIEANNEQIAEWAAKNPGVPINEVTIENQILHPHAGVASDAAHGTRMQLPPKGFTGVPADYHAPDASDATTEQLKAEVSTLKQELSGVRELVNATAMQPRVDGWIKPMLEAVPGSGSFQSSLSMAEFKKIPLRDIQYVMTHDSADAYERVHMTREQFANVKQFIQGAEKDSLVPPLNDIVGRKPDLKIGDYITKIALDPKVKVGYMVGGRGGFSTSI